MTECLTLVLLVLLANHVHGLRPKIVTTRKPPETNPPTHRRQTMGDVTDRPNVERYQCWQCKKIWKNKRGPQICPFCGHEYLTWLTFQEYDEWEGSYSSRMARLLKTEITND